MDKNRNRQKIKLLYLVSAPYSGSTLVAFLLGSHRGIATVGELSGPDPKIKKEEHPCSCGVPTVDCPFWREIQSRLQKKGLPFSVIDQNKWWQASPNKYVHHALTRTVGFGMIDLVQNIALNHLPPFSGRVKQFIDANAAVMREIIDFYDAEVFLDSSKDLYRLKILRQSPALDIRVLHLVRIGQGQIASQLRRRREITTSAKNLLRFDSQARNLHKLVGADRYLRVRYEDICREPETNLGRIAEFVGLDKNGFPDRFYSERMHIFGNPMSRDFIGKIDVDNRWEKELDESQLALLGNIIGQRNKDFGY